MLLWLVSPTQTFGGWLTFHGFHSLLRSRLLLDALKHRSYEFVHMRLNLGFPITRHEYVCVCRQAFSTTLSAAAFEVCDLLDPNVEFCLPHILRNVDIFAVEYLVDRVGTVEQMISALFASARTMMSRSRYESSPRRWDMSNSPPGSIAQIILIFRDLSTACATSSPRWRW